MAGAMTLRSAPAAPTGSLGPRDQEIKFCRAPDGVRLAYAVHGSGPPLIVASCWLSHLQYDWQSPVWRHFLDELGSLATVVRYDERGFGLSDWAVDDFSLGRPAGRPRGDRRGGRLRAVCRPRHVGRLGRRPGLCHRPPGSSQPADPEWHRLRRAGRLCSRRAGRGGDLSEDDRGRLGEGGSLVPARVHHEIHPGRDRGADALVRRPPADVDVAGQRRGQPDRPPAGRPRGRPAQDHGPDASCSSRSAIGRRRSTTPSACPR